MHQMNTTRRNAPPAPEKLAQAAELLRGGASQREVTRTTGLARETIRKHFPGQGWTYIEGGEFRALTRHSKIQIGNTP